MIFLNHYRNGAKHGWVYRYILLSFSHISFIILYLVGLNDILIKQYGTFLSFAICMAALTGFFDMYLVDEVIMKK